MEGIEAGEHDPHLVGYLRCFNAEQFYEAHDVLEALWLKDRNGHDGDFFKGLIQFAAIDQCCTQHLMSRGVVWSVPQGTPIMLNGPVNSAGFVKVRP